MQLPLPANDNQRRMSSLPISLPPRGLSRVQAAEYVGLSPTTFDLGVKDGTFPTSRRYRGRTMWDRQELDRAIDKLPRNIASNLWDEAVAA